MGDNIFGVSRHNGDSLIGSVSGISAEQFNDELELFKVECAANFRNDNARFGFDKEIHHAIVCVAVETLYSKAIDNVAVDLMVVWE